MESRLLGLNDAGLMATVLAELQKRGLDPEEFGGIHSVVSEVLMEALPEADQLLLDGLRREAPSMLRDWRRRRLAFETDLAKTWGKAFDLLQMLLVASYEAGEEFNNQHRPEASRDQDYVFDVLTRLHARACQVGFEVLALLRGGFAAGAHARWRTLHEIAVVAFFIGKHGSATAERYLAHNVVASCKAAMEYNDYCARLGYDPITGTELSRLTADYEDVLDRFGQEFRHPYGWAADVLPIKKPTFRDIEEDIGMDHMRPYYKLASYSVHADTKGITTNLGLPSSGPELLLAGPSESGLVDPGHGSAISLMQVTVALLSTRLSFENLMVMRALQALADEIGEAFLEAHERVEREASRHAEDQSVRDCQS